MVQSPRSIIIAPSDDEALPKKRNYIKIITGCLLFQTILFVSAFTLFSGFYIALYAFNTWLPLIHWESITENTAGFPIHIVKDIKVDLEL